MIHRPFIGICLVTLIWVGSIGGLWAHQAYLQTHGREIVLRTVPIDPRDLFRGEYVTLRYEISNYALPLYRNLNVEKGQVVYAPLRLDGKDWKIDTLTRDKPASGLFLQGRIVGVLKEKYHVRYDIEYGIESYFLPEGEGKRLEKLRQDRRLEAVINVTPQGQAKIKRLKEL